VGGYDPSGGLPALRGRGKEHTVIGDKDDRTRGTGTAGWHAPSFSSTDTLGSTTHGISSQPVTILLTDLEDSTRRWEEDAETMDAALARHDAILEEEIARHRGVVVKHRGDGVLAAFDNPDDGVKAAIAAQVALHAEQWPGPSLRVRMGLHTGDVRVRGGDVFGPTVNLAARIQNAAHGGHILVSATTEALVRGAVAPIATISDLGHWVLRNIHTPQHLFEISHPSLTGSPSRPRASRPGFSSLPVALSTFVDARGDLRRLDAIVANARLVTVVGPGGVGKSRLAVEVARQLEDTYADGARWCPLADVDDPSLVAAALESYLDLGGTVSSTERVLEVLRTRCLLLLVDNCEHLSAAVGAMIDRILRGCPDVTVLVTSRQPLRLNGEEVYEVAPWTSQYSAGAAAVRLFLDRAAAAGATFDDSAATHQRISALCERLDGLPLAIELAAAQTRALGMDELDRRLDERFQLLTSRGPPEASAPAHHQRLSDTVAWSYDLLDEGERVLFEKLAVFRGGLTPDAAESVCGEVGTWATLAQLCDRSLIQRDVGSPVTRYALLETVRAFALERLAERGEEIGTAERHARYFCEFAERADRERAGPGEADWVERELAEMANLRAAAMWTVEHADVDLALRLHVALYEVASLQGRVEIFDWLDPVAYRDSRHELVAAALAMAALHQSPSRPASMELAELASSLVAEGNMRPHRLIPWATGFAESSRGALGAAAAAYREAAELVRALEGENGHWISARALVAMVNRDATEARAVVADAFRVGQPSGMANALLAVARGIESDAPRALALTRRAYALGESVQNVRLLAYADLTAARIAAHHASPDVALGHLLAALSHAAEARHHEPMWAAVIRIGNILRGVGLDDAADAIVGAWIDAFPGAAARYPVLLAHDRSVDSLVVDDTGTPTERELCDRTTAIVERLRRDGLLAAAREHLSEEGGTLGA
jgi:predicted ATPase/class 3 adenylate cyclase